MDIYEARALAQTISLSYYETQPRAFLHDAIAKVVMEAVQSAVADARKEDAAIADSYDGIYHNTARHIAAAIRARGEKAS